MKLPAFVDRVPRIAFVLAVPVVAFFIFVALSFGSGDDNDDETAQAQPSATPVATRPASTPTQAPTAVPTAEPVPTAIVRTDCNAIRGTDYQSAEEREYFRTSCSGNTAAGSGSGGGTITGPQAAPSGGQAPTGERLIIPAAGVDAPVWLARVGSSGYMPDPVGYFNAVRYEFDIPGLGGNAGSGNIVMAAHVDCARCINGGSGRALFYSVRNLGVGDTAQFVTTSGTVKRYTVTRSFTLSPSADWNTIVSAGYADMTLITCTGSFSGGEYTLRHVVALNEV